VVVYDGLWPPPLDAVCAEPTIGAREAARTIYAEGRQSFQNGDYAQAASSFEQAYRIACKAHKLLFDLGRAHEAAGDAKSAVDAYELYLQRASPDADEAQALATRIARLRSKKP
jgi:predicted TPR repeat methyltransferase